MRLFICNSDHFPTALIWYVLNGRQEESHKVKLSPNIRVRALFRETSVNGWSSCTVVFMAAVWCFITTIRLETRGSKMSLSWKCRSFLSWSAWSWLQCAVCCFVFPRRPKRQSKPSDDGYWDCSVCTFKNSAEAFKCLMCDVRKGTSTR